MDLVNLQSGFGDLYAKLKKQVWIVKITASVDGGGEKTVIRTAFAVHKDGFLVTSSHVNWPNWAGIKIMVRTLVGSNEFKAEAMIVARKPQCDLCLLQIKNCTNQVDVASLGKGNLDVCQTIIAIGHPCNCIGSGLLGHIVYPCIDNTVFKFDEYNTCRNYLVSQAEEISTHRVMGHVCNAGYHNDKLFEYVRMFQPDMPIIHSAGLFGSGGGGKGSSGAPIFNLEEEIVGMFSFGMDGYDIGVHVSVIKKFVDEFCPKDQADVPSA